MFAFNSALSGLRKEDCEFKLKPGPHSEFQNNLLHIEWPHFNTAFALVLYVYLILNDS